MKEILTLVQLQHEDGTIIASVGGFELEYSGERFGMDGYRYATMLVRTGLKTEIELSVTTTPLGAIAKLEHVLANLDEAELFVERDGSWIVLPHTEPHNIGLNCLRLCEASTH